MTRLTFVLAVLSAAFSLCGAQARSEPPEPPTASAPVDDTLFRALGGHPGIERIVGDFVPRLAADPRTSEFFRKARQDHLKLMLSQKFCVLAGGPCVYTGKPMAEAHHDMDISRADFNALVEVLQASMDAQGVPFPTQNRLLAKLAPLHREIVTQH